MPFLLPTFWQHVHLEGPSYRVQGGVFPGCPVFGFGHNGALAWGCTTGFRDAYDLYRIHRLPDDASRYRTTHGSGAITKHREVVPGRLGRPVIAFSEAMRANDAALKAFLYERMYRHYKVNRMASRARRVVRELFGLFIAEPECLPEEWRARCDAPGSSRTARVAADYIAGMTDRYAFKEHHRLFGLPEA